MFQGSQGSTEKPVSKIQTKTQTNQTNKQKNKEKEITRSQVCFERLINSWACRGTQLSAAWGRAWSGPSFVAQPVLSVTAAQIGGHTTARALDPQGARAERCGPRGRTSRAGGGLPDPDPPPKSTLLTCSSPRSKGLRTTPCRAAREAIETRKAVKGRETRHGLHFPPQTLRRRGGHRPDPLLQ